MKPSTFKQSLLLILGCLLSFKVNPVAGIFNRQSLLLHDALSLSQCDATRQALVRSSDRDNYFRLLVAMRADLDLLRSAAITGDIVQITSVTGFIPPVVESEDSPVGAGVQQILEFAAGQGLGLNFFGIARDVLTLVCDGFETERRFPLTAWQRIKQYAISLGGRRQTPDRVVTNFFRSENYIYVTKANSWTPGRVWKRLRPLLEFLGDRPIVLRTIPFTPVIAAARVLTRFFDGLGDTLTRLIDRTQQFCSTTDPNVESILLALRVLINTRLALSVYSVLTPLIVKGGFATFNAEYRLLLEQENVPTCPLTETIAPTTGDGFAQLTNFLINQISATDAMIREWRDENEPSVRGRALIDTTAYTGQFDPVRQVSGFISDMANATTTISNALDDLVNTFLSPLGSVGLQNLLVELPNRLEELIDRMRSIADGLEGPVDIVQAILDNVPSPPSPFGEIISFFEGIICEAVDFLTEQLFGFELCEVIDSFFEDLFSSLFGDFEIPTFENLFGELNLFGNILGIFDFNANGFLDLGSLLPSDLSYLADRFAFDLNLENPMERLNGLFDNIALTPVDVFVQNLDRPSALPDGVSREIFTTMDSTVVEYRCPVGTTPVTTEATYRIIGSGDDACAQSLIGQLRYPCDSEDDNECDVDVEALLSCQLPVNQLLYNDLGLSSSKLFVTYFCFEDLSSFKLPVVLTNGTNTVRLFELEDLFTDPQVFPREYFFVSPVFTSESTRNSDLQNYYGERNGDVFRRVGYGGAFAQMAPLDCSTGFADRRILIEKMDFYFDPCLAGGFSFPSTTRQGDSRPHELCGYKVLYDHNVLNGCPEQQIYSDAKRTESFSLLDFIPQPSNSLGIQPICWSEFNGGLNRVPWQELALNLENCEIFFQPGSTTRSCPFYNAMYFGQANFVGFPTAGISETFFEGTEACFSPDSILGIGMPYPPFRDGLVDSNPLFVDNSNIRNAANCNLRRGLQRTLNNRFNNYFSADIDMFPDTVDTPPNQPNIDAYGVWEDALNNQQERCTEAVQQCIQNENRCDLVEMECVPPGALWACVEDPEDPRTTRTHMWGDSYTSGVQIEDKTVTCPSVSVSIDGQTLALNLELLITSALEADSINDLSWDDLTEDTKTYCNVVEGVSSCTFSQGTAGFPSNNFIREVETQCKCPPGYEEELLDGTCEPCSAGSARGRQEEVCDSCSVGTYAGPASSECGICPVGTFSPNPGGTNMDSCYRCRRGTFAATEGSFECEDCPAGMYQPNEGKDFCLPVNASFYQPEEGATFQLPCPSGSSSDYNATECTLCPVGTFAGSGAAVRCADCPPGSYAAGVGSASCELCPYGYYSDSPATDICQPCDEGLTTRARGASSVDSCVAPFDPLELEQIYLDGSAPEFNTGEMVPLPDFNDTGIETRNIQEVDRGCLDLLAKYTNPEISETLKLLEIGNGYCNGGPWNTPPCRFDGGDCCPQTCNLGLLVDGTTDQEVVSKQVDGSVMAGRCYWLDMQCRDTDSVGTGESLQCTETRRRFRRRRQRMLRRRANEESGGHGKEEESTEATRATRATSRRELLVDADPSMVGNGLCNQELNNANFSYDGGDCCQSTCEFNELFTESCRPRTLACKDPDVLMAEKFEDVDSAPPMIKAVDDFIVECGQVPEYILDSVEESPFNFTVTDNDPCFEGVAAVTYSREIVPRSSDECDGPQFLFRYTAEDASGNTGTKTVTVFEKDTLAPVVDCVNQALNVEPGQTDIQLPSLMAQDSCDGEIPVVYTTSVTGVSIDNNGLMTNWQGAGSPIIVTATATDNCGHVQQCNIEFTIVTQAPTSSPTASPSSAPSESMMPSTEPSASPTETLVLPSLEVTPRRIGAGAITNGRVKLRINVLSSEQLNVAQIDIESLLVGKTGTETKPEVLDPPLDVNKDGVDILRLRVDASMLGFTASDTPGSIDIILSGLIENGGGQIQGVATIETMGPKRRG